MPRIECPVSNDDFEEMVEVIDPLSHSNDHAIDIYLQCISFVQSRMSVKYFYEKIVVQCVMQACEELTIPSCAHSRAYLEANNMHD